MSETILIIEDDQEIIDVIKDNVSDLSLKVDYCNRGDDGLSKALSKDYALVILDVGLPGMNGLDICKKLRIERQGLPIIMLTSRTTEVDKILGLEFGADDYVGKPFSARELVARIRALLRRSKHTQDNFPGTTSGIRLYGSLQIDFDTRVVKRNMEEVKLTATEFDILALLANNEGRPFTRTELAEHILGVAGAGHEASINSHLCRMRGKIELDPNNPKLIETVRGIGYRFAKQLDE